MKIDVYFTPLGLAGGDLGGRAIVVIDVLRATTTVVTALANGAKAVIPAATSEEAVRLASNLEKDGVLLAGERSEEHTSELQSPCNLVCRLLLEKKKKERQGSYLDD